MRIGSIEKIVYKFFIYNIWIKNNNFLMRFITIKDLNSKFKKNVLSDTVDAKNIISNNDPILTIIESDAIELLTSYLSNRYNMDSIIGQSGDNRNRLIVNIICDIMIYELLIRISTDSLPEIREEKYERTLKIMADLRDAKLTIDIPEKNANYDNKNQLLWSSDKSNYCDW